MSSAKAALESDTKVSLLLILFSIIHISFPLASTMSIA